MSSSTSSRPKKYLCDYPDCVKAYSKPSLLEQHKRSHTNDRPFKCSHAGCDKSFLRKSHLDNHLLSHKEEDQKPFHCSICGKGVNSLQHLKRHEITHTKSFECPHDGCSESFYKHQSLRHHVLSVHEKSLTCKICDKTFSRPYRLAQHNIKYHGDSPTYQCDHPGCYSNFKTWSALQFHIKTEHPKLKCSVCGKGCVGKKGLKSHMLSHDEETVVKLWNCNYCNIGKFSKKFDLIEHYKAYHDGNIPEDLLKLNERIRLEELLSETDDDGGRIKSLKDLKNFEILRDSDQEEAEEFETLSEAPNSTKSMNTLNSNLRGAKASIIGLILDNYHLKKIKCPKNNCERTFSREYDLTRHLKWHEQHLKKIELFLETLGETEGLEPNLKKRRIEEVGDYEYDEELDSLIDDELKLLTAGSMKERLVDEV
ncbi:uncharacterized protein CANTADRAFT_4546 [Suhomyces tanzawaensis NRRL Y-17324]|uniref:Transcription factor IIIA n=1 Tax=Suhomyces tanzawaensis NRRL Y-17324 TaxID=984487 RepID=A0A1E4SM78_9ASCO|nr:uncharacterized protein CANTADRAFT_4546 [Suhomyces tanzawaensis NRRL Y-17324]ODV80517.1 hypothetical protein CANTADRAFT_4546 [Suhomyces tanzawaensis NRRL Y-17324]